MGVKPAKGTGGRALPAGRGWVSAQREGSAAQGSGLRVHWYLNPVILARQLRGAGAGRRGAPRGFPPPAGNQTRSRFPGLCGLGEVWAETGWSLRVRLRGTLPPQPLPAPPPGPLLEGDRARGEGCGPAASCGYAGERQCPPTPPNPSSVQTHLLSPGFLGSGRLGQPLPPSPQLCPRPALLALPSQVSAPLGGRGAPLGFPAQTECRISQPGQVWPSPVQPPRPG